MQHLTTLEVPRRRLYVAVHDKSLETLTKIFLDKFSPQWNVSYHFVKTPQELLDTVEQGIQQEEPFSVMMDVNYGNRGSTDFSIGEKVYDLLPKHADYRFVGVTGLPEQIHGSHRIPRSSLRIKPYDMYTVLEHLVASEPSQVTFK